MILEYGLRNYFSFKEGAVVSFRLDRNTPENTSMGLPFATAVGVNGANAAGKTHLLKALDFLAWFNTASFSWKTDRALPLEPYGRSEDPCEFYIEFACGELEYRYECAISSECVHREVLYRTKAKRVKLFERVGNEVSGTREMQPLRSLAYRKNVSVISTLHQYQLPLIADVFRFFEHIRTNVTYGGYWDFGDKINSVAALCHKYPDLLHQISAFIRKCDTGVDHIVIHQREGEKGEPIFFPVFMHEIDGEFFEVTPAEESNGTKRLFQLAPFYFQAIELGGVAVVDELDVHMHPAILPLIVHLFTSPESNPKHAQLLFTSHDERIIDELGRYRTYLAMKEDNQSFAFRLDEIPGDILRNDRPLSPVYIAGKVGGIPRL